MKKVLFCVLSSIGFVLSNFISLMILGKGGINLGEENASVLLILIWIIFLVGLNGVAIFRSDEGFKKPSFITYLVFGGISLALALVLMFIIPNTLTGVVFKNTVVPITLAMIIFRYIDVGYERDGWISNVLVPSLMFVLEQMIYYLFVVVKFVLLGYLVLYGVALVGLVFAIVKSIKEGGLADGSWESGKPYVRKSSSQSRSYSTSSLSSGGSSTNSFPKSNFKPATAYEIENMLRGLSAYDIKYIYEVRVDRVSANSYDNGFNFDIEIHVKGDVIYGQKARAENLTQSEAEYVMESAMEYLSSKIKEKLDSRGIGYNVSFN